MCIVFLFHQKLLECDTIPVSTPSQNRNEHMILDDDDLHQQPLYDEQTLHSIPLSQLEIRETQAIASFSTELSAYLHQQQNNTLDDIPPMQLLVHM